MGISGERLVYQISKVLLELGLNPIRVTVPRHTAREYAETTLLMDGPMIVDVSASSSVVIGTIRMREDEVAPQKAK